ncbi:MAG: hypothetical protein AAB583_01030 [Patescibacteria group bacterium]
MVELKPSIPFTELKKLRRKFGPGNAGRSAFRIIAKGAMCEGIIRNENGESDKCRDRAQFTLDFDAPRVNALEQIAACRGCIDTIKSSVQQDFERQGSFYSFSINGKGRF